MARATVGPVIEELTRSDWERCMDLAQRVGWPREPEKWSLLFAMGPGFGCRDGSGALSAMVVLPAFERASFVAMMAVDPRAQGTGLARALLEHAMRRAPRLMLYATARGRPVYERLGFRELDGVRKYSGVPRAIRASATVRAATVADYATILDHDTRSFGMPRPRLIDALLSAAQRVVVDDRGGFAIRWYTGELNVVGPVVAETDDAAVALVEGALAGCTTRALVNVTAASPRLAAHLQSLGLEEREPAPLMTWPDAFVPGDRTRYRAIALQALG